MTEWYRRKTWTKVDEEEYFTKLKRARKSGRPQYLMIQASTLVGTANPAFLDVAEALISQLFAEYPDDKFNKSSSLGLLGDIYRLREQYETAIEYYRKAVEFEKEYPNVQTGAFLQFSELVVKLGKQESFGFAEEILSDNIEQYPFPIYKYKIASLLSIINKANGNKERASQLAGLADQYASAETSGFRYHKSLGVVTERDQELDELVRKEK